MAIPSWWVLERLALERAHERVGEAERERLVRHALRAGHTSGATVRRAGSAEPPALPGLRPLASVLRWLLGLPAGGARRRQQTGVALAGLLPGVAP